MDEILPGNPGGRSKAARWRRLPFRESGWHVLLLFRDVKGLLRRGNPDLRSTASGTKGDLPFNRTSAAVANILHTFLKLQEVSGLGKPGKPGPENLRESSGPILI
jgi:hypothetical protein